MRRPQFIFVICASLITLGFLPFICAAAPSAEDLERKAIMYRIEKTKRGYVRMHVVNEVGPQQSEFLYELTYDGNRARQVRRCRLLGKAEWGKPEKIVVTPKTYMEDAEYIGGAEPSVSVSVAPATDYKDPGEHLRVLNAQALGMDLEGADMLHRTTVEALLNRSDRSKPTVHADRLGELETWRLDYQQKPSDRNMSVWIAPSQGYSVVRAELRANMKDGQRLVQTTDSPLKQYPAGGIWYPSSVTKIVTHDGRVVRRQVVAIEEARFGGPIDGSAFTLAGLDLKPGRQVTDSTSGQAWLKVWDGTKAVDPANVPTAVPPTTDRPRLLLGVIALGLALLAVFYFWRVFQQKRSASRPSG